MKEKNKKNRKWISIILVLLLSISLISCNRSSGRIPEHPVSRNVAIISTSGSTSRADEKSILASGKKPVSRNKDGYATDDKARYPYPSEYMNAHKVKVEKKTDTGRKEMNVSSTLFYEQIDYEGMLGLNIKVNGNKVSIKYFDHSGDTDTMKVTIGDETVTLTWGESISRAIKGDKMVIKGVSSRDAKHDVYAEVRKTSDGYKVYGTESEWISIPDGVIDPKSEEVTSTKGLTYPTSGKYGRCVHVKQWENKADEITIKDEWSDEFKVYRFLNYFAKECAYDEWGYGERALKVPGKTDDGYMENDNFLYYSHVGVCFDYVNALVIMCRHIGIPATSLDTYKTNHTLALVYLNDEWVAIDPIDVLYKQCKQEDTSPDKWEKRGASFTRAYGVLDMNPYLFWNTQIWQGN